jgi:transposase InsO family protein
LLHGQYLSIKYTERLAAAGIEPSVDSVGDSYDNALAETINGLYKTEVVHRCGPGAASKRSAQLEKLLTYVAQLVTRCRCFGM